MQRLHILSTCFNSCGKLYYLTFELKDFSVPLVLMEHLILYERTFKKKTEGVQIRGNVSCAEHRVNKTDI